MRPIRTRVVTALTSVAITASALIGVATVAAPAAQATVTTYALSSLRLGNGTTRVARWNPCQTITYKVNLAAVPLAQRTTALSETQTAFRLLAARTGFTFAYRGATTEVPRAGTAATQTAEIVVAWTTPARTTYPLAGSVVGYGGWSGSSWATTVSGRTTYGAAITRGFLVVDTPDALRMAAGYGTGLRRGNILLHELGHAAGLQHATDTRQLMYPTLRSTSPNGYAWGDVAGLGKVGRPAGCITIPSAVVKDLT